MTEADRAVIGCMILDAKSTSGVFRLIDQRMFEEPALAAIFHCCYKLHKAGIPYDAVTVLSKLGEDYKLLIAECAQLVPSISRLEHYAAEVMEDWRRRTLAGQLAELQLGDYTSGETLKRLRDLGNTLIVVMMFEKICNVELGLMKCLKDLWDMHILKRKK